MIRKTAEETTAEFKADLLALLAKYADQTGHPAELAIEDRGRNYQTDPRMIVTISGIYTDESRRAYTEIDLGTWVCD